MISKSVVERLKENFLHQYLVFFLKEMNVVVSTEDGEGLTMSAMLDGFCIDIDEHGYYLGREEDGFITKIISHASIGIVELMAETADSFEGLQDLDEAH